MAASLASNCRNIAIVSLVIANCYVTSAFNLDSSVPIVKSVNGRGSYFGYSIAQHLISGEGAQGGHVLLVGAPRANRSDHGHENISEPGVIYRCPISTAQDDCYRVVVDDAISRGYDKSNQWLGVAVSSQNKAEGLALVCAHRTKRYGPAYVWGQGLCFSLSNALEESQTYEPCSGKSTNKGHEEYGFCQAGTSVALDKTGDFLLGAPGPFNWKGCMYKNEIESWNSEWFEVSGEGVVPAISYFGMSVKIGRLFGDSNLTYIGGAPNSKGTGEVLMFQRRNSNFDLVRRLAGEQSYSSFGYDFIVGDFNGDGLEDLVVGAPFYREQGVGGAIYIYLNSKSGLASKPKKKKVPTATLR